jgi:hypothetical protein
MSEDSKPRTFKSRAGREIPLRTAGVTGLVHTYTPREMIRIAEGGDPAGKDSLTRRVEEARKRARAVSEREAAISQFREMKNAIIRADQQKQTIFSIGLAIQWRAFLETFGGPSAFLSSIRMSRYYNKLIVLTYHHRQNNDGEKILPTLLMDFVFGSHYGERP